MFLSNYLLSIIIFINKESQENKVIIDKLTANNHFNKLKLLCILIQSEEVNRIIVSKLKMPAPSATSTPTQPIQNKSPNHLLVSLDIKPTRFSFINYKTYYM